MIFLLFVAAALCTLTGDWEKFKIRYGKKYAKSEEDLRMAIFNDNVRYAALLNKIDDHATYGVTKFSDLTAEEFAQRHLGFVPTVQDGDECYNPTEAEIASAPLKYDWRDHGVLNPIQDQAQCGSCWAFATVAVVEAANAIANGNLWKLSEQQLVDCDESNGGCDGGNMYPAEGYVQRNGLTTEEAYPYKGVTGTCKSFEPKAYIKNHCLIIYSKANAELVEDRMMYHLSKEGPLVVGINANKAQLYISGIMNANNCNPNGVDHAVVAVAYNRDNGDQPYWVIRNSWGASWGEEGYFRMIYGENCCGVATSASYVFA